MAVVDWETMKKTKEVSYELGGVNAYWAAQNQIEESWEDSKKTAANEIGKIAGMSLKDWGNSEDEYTYNTDNFWMKETVNAENIESNSEDTTVYKDGGADQPIISPKAGKKIYSRNLAAEFLLKSGADRLKHTFDVIFMLRSDSEDQSFLNLLRSLNVNKTVDLLGKTRAGAFLARTRGISVPRPKQQTFSLKIGYDVVEKISTQHEFNKIIEIPFLLSDNFSYFTAFNLISGNNRTACVQNMYDDVRFYPFTTLRTIKENLKSKKFTLDLIVQDVSLTSNINETMAKTRESFYKTNNRKLFALPKKDESPFWYFEDVDILGWSDDIEFNSEDASPIQNTLKCIFKSVYFLSPETLENKRLELFDTLSNKDLNVEKFKDSIVFDESKLSFNPETGAYKTFDVNNLDFTNSTLTSAIPDQLAWAENVSNFTKNLDMAGMRDRILQSQLQNALGSATVEEPQFSEDFTNGLAAVNASLKAESEKMKGTK